MRAVRHTAEMAPGRPSGPIKALTEKGYFEPVFACYVRRSQLPAQNSSNNNHARQQHARGILTTCVAAPASPEASDGIPYIDDHRGAAVTTNFPRRPTTPRATTPRTGSSSRSGARKPNFRASVEQDRHENLRSKAGRGLPDASPFKGVFPGLTTSAPATNLPTGGASRAGAPRQREHLFDYVKVAAAAAPMTPRGCVPEGPFLSRGDAYVNSAGSTSSSSRGFRGERREEDFYCEDADVTRKETAFHKHISSRLGQHRPGIDRLLHAFLSNGAGGGPRTESGSSAQPPPSTGAVPFRVPSPSEKKASATTDHFFVCYYLEPWRDYEKAWQLFSDSPTPIHSADDVPLPPGQASGTILRRAWRAESVPPYHPDKFMARFPCALVLRSAKPRTM